MDGLDKIMKGTSMMKYATGLEKINSFALALENSGLGKIQRELQTIHSIVMENHTDYYAMTQGLTSVLENYNKVSEVTSVARTLAETIQPLSIERIPLEGLKTIANAISPFSELSSMVINNPSFLTCLHSTLEAQIDTSLFDYLNEMDQATDDELAESMCEELISIVDEENKEGLIKQVIIKYGEKGIRLLASFLLALLMQFLYGWVTYCSEPIYKMITPSFLRPEQSIESTQTEEIPANTEVHVWGDVTNNFVEISYSVEGVHYQGYISREEFERNTQKISNEIELEHICFINDMVEVLSECWNVDNETVYRFLKEDTNLLNDYVLEHYDVLKHMDNEELISALETYCETQGIVIPKVQTE